MNENLNHEVTRGRADSLNVGDLFLNNGGMWIAVTGIVIDEDGVKVRGVNYLNRERIALMKPESIRKIIRRGEAPPSL